MIVPPQATQLVKHFEGFSAHPYRDHGGWSVGYGFWSHSKPHDMTRVEADTKLQLELASLQRHIIASLHGVQLKPRQVAALDDFAYNEGVGNWLHSTLRRMIMIGSIRRAAAQFSRWVYIGHARSSGLLRRRTAEASIFRR